MPYEAVIVQIVKDNEYPFSENYICYGCCLPLEKKNISFS